MLKDEPGLELCVVVKRLVGMQRAVGTSSGPSWCCDVITQLPALLLRWERSLGASAYGHTPEQYPTYWAGIG